MDIRYPPNTLTDFLPYCSMIKNSYIRYKAARGLCLLEIGHVLNVKIH
jgi:hypothetical protein